MFKRLILIVALACAGAASAQQYRARPLGLEPVSSTPEEMAATMRREQERYATIIRNANIKIEQ